MAREQLLAAKDLIQKKRYSEARQLLLTIDSPTAKQWLNKLDEIAPDTPAFQPIHSISTPPEILSSFGESAESVINTNLQEMVRSSHLQIEQQNRQIKLLQRVNGSLILLMFLMLVLLSATLFSGTGLLAKLVPQPIAPGQSFETDTIDCREIKSYADKGWRVVAAYSYQTGSSSFGYTVYTNCVIERPR